MYVVRRAKKKKNENENERRKKMKESNLKNKSYNCINKSKNNCDIQQKCKPLI